MSLNSRGSLELGRHGVAVDWLVLIHRLPESLVFEKLIERGQVPERSYALATGCPGRRSRAWRNRSALPLQTERA